MRDHARELLTLMHGRSRGDLDADRMLALADPWSSIVGLRNRLIHGYDDVDHDIVWAIVSTDLPTLVSQLSD